MAIPMHARHCFQLSLSVSANFFKNSTIITCRITIMLSNIQNSLFFFSLSKMSVPFTVLNMAKIWQRTKMLKIKVSFSPPLSLKVASPSNCMISIFCIRLSAGSSTERTRTTNVPTTNFTQSSWRAAYGILPDEMDVTMLISGGSPEKIVVIESVTREAIVAVSWNCAYIWMLL